MWEHIEWLIGILVVIAGSVYTPIYLKRKSDERAKMNAIWKKLDKLDEDLTNNYYTKPDCDSKMKHRIQKAIMKQTIERLKDESTGSKEDR